MKEFTLTVRDILVRQSFKDATVIAGKSGLDRQVKWSHILEVKDFGSLINGGEMILTTGIGLQQDIPTQLMFISQLIEREVACLCIEIGDFFQSFPPEVIQLANLYNFPIITFDKTVKFVDITQDLHTHIINQHHEMLSKLDTMSRELGALSLMPNGILKILQELHQLFGKGIVFISDEAKTYYYPSNVKNLETSIRTYMEITPHDQIEQKQLSVDGKNLALMPVTGLGQTLGYLCLEATEKQTDEFTFLMLDRAALAIAQITLRNRTIEERKQNNEDEFIRNLLNGRSVEQDDIQTYLPSMSRNMHYRVFVIQVDHPESHLDEASWEEIKLQRSMMIRTLLKRNGFFPAVSSNKNSVAVIASFIAADHLKNEQDRFVNVIQQIQNTNEHTYLKGSSCSFGLSMVYKNITDVQKGYEEALKVIQMRNTGIIDTVFYENLGVYRLLLLVDDKNYLQAYVQDYLAELLAYDEKMESNLFETLRFYLKCGGAKKETADRLFIVRQTLYHRLEKIESLLGSDFMEPSKRLTLEVAIMAYQLLYPNKKENKKSLSG
ncbi:PucR family transcriptional regulator [Sporosarcina sp. HYO08]|uniref:PucR family transcriptional regulator n=1 Tax=Sporosarcina sp. HYO08 TaxID=1759557 RepID=UPI00079C7710|nr:PucR family transcriptional regulator [Sporosarcina sp. HYO08]KXH83800.1 sugar diacid utilization regulator SdaR [Sporosarcina sp. HYO08]